MKKCVAIVTGGTRGIGAGISKALQEKGYLVAAVFTKSTDRAHAFQKETGIPIYQWDISDYSACQKGISQVVSDLGPVDVLVNNGGITRDGFFHKQTPENWENVINTNLNSCYNMTRGVIEGMRERGFGRIISISSINALKGQAGQVNYSAAKAGIIGFTKALALENASKGVTVNAIAPGYIDTDMVRAVTPDVLEKIIAQIPVGRLGLVQEVARTVVFLADEAAGYMTGATLNLNGGQHLV